MKVLVRTLPYALAFFSSFCIMILELVASRLVARHVGASLNVWTSVIGIVLGGICLGNVLGGRLADRTEPGRAIGPLYALGAALTLACLWINAVVGWTPGLDILPWGLRTVVVVTLDFLIPATVLGMISPVVAKMAVEQARRSGSALGDVYFMGAAGSIAGTFVAGFYLIYLLPTSTIVTLVAAALALLAAALLRDRTGRLVGLATAACLGLGAIGPVVGALSIKQGSLAGIPINPLVLAGYVLMVVLAMVAVKALRRAVVPEEGGTEVEEIGPEKAGVPRRTGLADLAILSFVASLAFMALEMVAGRLVTRHLGSSVYGWTSVIGVLLGGLSVGNLIGGKIADFVREEKQASWLFLVASVLTTGVLLAETPPSWVSHLVGDTGPILSRAITLTGYAWWSRVLLVVAVVFFLPAVAMGTVSPVVAKLAVDRLRRSRRTGTAIGQVYAWGMVGSILGTFLAGFVLIDVLGTKGLILALGTALALAATTLGTVWHAAWAGIPLGLCVIALVPSPWFRTQALAWGIREESGDPQIEEDGMALADESNYYFIKVSNEPVDVPDGPKPGLASKRTLVLDNLIHGYFTLGHPERIEYDYEFIYAQVAYRAFRDRLRSPSGGGTPAAAASPLRVLFLGGGSYTFPRYLQATYPGTACDVAEIDPAVTRANHVALGLPRNTPIRTTWGDARQFVEKNQGQKPFDLVFGDAFNDFSVPWHLTTKEFNDKIARLMTDDGVYMINIIDVYQKDDADALDAATIAKAKREGKAPVKGEDPLRFGGFIGSWVETARLTFPHIYVFGTDKTPGSGLRETFVVVASKRPLDLTDIGRRADDPLFDQDGENFEPDPFSAEHMRALKRRSRGIILTDDYAPVDNLLAPVAATRGD